MTVLALRTPDLEVSVENRIAVICHKESGRYFQSNVEVLPHDLRTALQVRQPRVSNRFGIWLLFVVMSALVGQLLFLGLASPGQAGLDSILPLVMFAFLTIAVHEAGHVLALRWFGRKADKVGFKLHFVVLPAFYVRMNESLLLSKYEKVVVHSAGIGANVILNSIAIVVNIAVLHSDGLLFAIQLMVLSLVFNAVPFLNSDGYRVILALTGTNELKSKLANPWWVKALKLTSVVLVLWYTWSWVSPLLNR